MCCARYTLRLSLWNQVCRSPWKTAACPVSLITPSMEKREERLKLTHVPKLTKGIERGKWDLLPGLSDPELFTFPFTLSPPPCVVSPQWVMAFFLMVCNVSFLRLLLPITNLNDCLHRRKENTETAYICIWMHGWQTTMGGGNKMCSMNFAIFALRELEEFTEPSAWR